MNEKPATSKSRKVLLGEDLPSPVPDNTHWWNPIRLRWMSFQPLKNQGQAPHKNLWHAVLIT